MKQLQIELTEEEKKALKQMRLKRNSSIGDRAHYILLSNEGYSIREIATHLNRNRLTVRLWVKRYQAEGLEGLMSRKQPGRPAEKAPVIEEILQELLAKNPKEYGYQEAGWHINLLQDWLKKQGVTACDNTIVKALNKLGFVYKRFSKTPPKKTLTAEEKQAQVGDMVKLLEKTAQNHDAEILFLDESHFSNQPYVNRGWFKRGEKKQSRQLKSD